MSDPIAPDADFTPVAWLEWAEKHLAAARAYEQVRDHAQPRHACIWAGVSARFAIRAALVATASPTHESNHLAELSAQLPSDLARLARPAVDGLSRYGEEINYPDGEIRGLTWQDAETGVSDAAQLLSVIRAELASNGVVVTTR